MKRLLISLILCAPSLFAQGPTGWTHYDVSSALLQYRGYNSLRYMDGTVFLYEGRGDDGSPIYAGTFLKWAEPTQTLTQLSYTGESTTSNGCTLAQAWTTGFAYAVHQQYTDSAHHLQVVSVAGTSGTSEPTWNHAGATTVDGGVTWTDMGIQPPSRHPMGQWWADINRHRIYVTGGVCGEKDPETPGRVTMWYWSTLTNTWTGLETAQSPYLHLGGTDKWMSGGSAFDWQDNIVVQYGSAASAGKHTFVYCPTDLNPIPGTLTPIQSAAGCVADDWAAVASSGSLPNAAHHANLVYTRGGKVILFGGTQSQSGGSTTYNQTMEYDIPTKTWRVLNSGASASPPVVPYSSPLKGQAAMAYNTRNERVYVWANLTGHMWSLDPINGNGQWVDHGVSAGPVCAPTNMTQCTEKMVYDDINNKLVLLAYTNDLGVNATIWVATLPPKIPGLGASTVTCLDKDGDGYGVGPGCTGADADDNDATVHTKAQAVAGHTNLNTFFQYRGYYPDKYWIIATNGSNGTGRSCTPANLDGGGGGDCLPYATWAAISASITAGDAVLFRGGTYTEQLTPVGGAAGNPVFYLAYPGELPYINKATSGQAVSTNYISNIVIDGFKLNGVDTSAINGGTYEAGGVLPSEFHNNVFRNLELPGGPENGVRAMYNMLHCLWEDIVTYGHAHHGIYLGSQFNINHDIVVRRILSYENGFTAIQHNGRVDHLLIDGVQAYNNEIATISFEEGVSSAIVQNVATTDNASSAIVFYTYDGNEGGGGCGPGADETCVCLPTPNEHAICPYNTRGNQFRQITSYRQIVGDADHPAIISARASIGSCATDACLATDQAQNIFRNMIVVERGYGSLAGGNAVPPLTFVDDTAPVSAPTTTVDRFLYQLLDGDTSFLGLWIW